MDNVIVMLGRAPSPLSLHRKNRKFSPDFDSIPTRLGNALLIQLSMDDLNFLLSLVDALVGPGYRGWYLCYLIAVL